MPKRNPLGNRDLFREEPEQNIEYKSPEARDIELLSLGLLHYYITERDKERSITIGKSFEYMVENMESMIEYAGDKLQPQSLIDSLTAKLRYEHDRGINFTRTDYLTAVVQALYNLDYSCEFAVNITNWPDGYHFIGDCLKGRPSKPITLNLYGNFYECGSAARHCIFSLMPNAEIIKYQAGLLGGNLLRKMKADGEWEIIM